MLFQIRDFKICFEHLTRPQLKAPLGPLLFPMVLLSVENYFIVIVLYVDFRTPILIRHMETFIIQKIELTLKFHRILIEILGSLISGKYLFCSALMLLHLGGVVKQG